MAEDSFGPGRRMDRMYLKYLRSPEFDRVRQAAFRRDRWRCVSCGNTEEIEVHHGIYDWIYEELSSPQAFASVVTLCHQCHRETHGLGREWSDLIQEVDEMEFNWM